ncbi:surfeit locus protein 6 [Ascaphus truei]|uniref:surfeit locus protein 6 n=1 Tax=Ascaphus truei TaxID=8439 RepID=UPI003F595CAE
MASLASKDSYLQSLGRKVCAQNTEPRKRKIVFINRDGSDESSQPKKKKKKRPRKGAGKSKPDTAVRGGPPKPGVRPQQAQSTGEGPTVSFSTVDVLRKRLHEKMQESRGQVSTKGLSPEEAEKRRQRRKQERERKKRKRKDIKMKATQTEEARGAPEIEQTPEANGRQKEKDQEPMVFNKVEVHDEPPNKVTRKKEKKEKVKGNITPLTGKNYKQLLSRLESRNNKLEALRAKDQAKANEMETKIKWTNLLYKAEGVKIKDDEGMLKVALKRKEKKRDQRKKRWDKRTEQVTDRMQQRQDKRSRNILKKKTAKKDKKKDKARKKGRVLPEDLAKAKLK